MRAMLAAALRRLAHRLEPAPPVRPVTMLEIDTETIIRAIKARNRRKGLGGAGI